METINFMYFMYNYGIGQIEECLQVTNDPRHLISKWKGYDSSGHEVFRRLFYELSPGNQLAVVEWVTNNYNHKQLKQ